MKNYTLNQVRKALENKGFQPTTSFTNEIVNLSLPATEATTIFEKSSGTQFGLEFATVEECLKDGTCTIDGLNPKEWGKQLSK